MKRLILLMALVAIVAILMAAAPAPHITSDSHESKQTTTQYTGKPWDSIAAVISVASDSARVLITASGVALMDASDKLYLGFSALDEDSLPEIDTLIIQNGGGWFSRQAKVPFHFAITRTHNAATTDTIYFLASAGGSGNTDKVTLESVIVTCQVSDQ